MLSRLLMRSKEVGNAQFVQQTSNIFLMLPPTLSGRNICASFFSQESVDNYSKNVRVVI